MTVGISRKRNASNGDRRADEDVRPYPVIPKINSGIADYSRKFAVGRPIYSRSPKSFAESERKPSKNSVRSE